jgi:hypothetical protein
MNTANKVLQAVALLILVVMGIFYVRVFVDAVGGQRLEGTV